MTQRDPKCPCWVPWRHDDVSCPERRAEVEDAIAAVEELLRLPEEVES